MANRGLQPLHRDIGGDLQHHLILDEAGLGGRRNVDHPPAEAGRQLLAARGLGRRLLLRRQPDAVLEIVDHRRRVEGGELERAPEILNCLRLLRCLLRRQRSKELERER